MNVVSLSIMECFDLFRFVCDVFCFIVFYVVICCWLLKVWVEFDVVGWVEVDVLDFVL